MKKILFVPLDERPCNYDFPLQLAAQTDYELLVPPREILGKKKQAGDVDAIWKWLLENVSLCDGAILSIDTLLYSGIVPSRLHDFNENALISKLDSLKQLKEINPDLKIYAFNLIMRNPHYSSSDEEPDYYGVCGREIHMYGVISHKIELGIASEDEIKELDDILNHRLPAKHLEDYLSRRKKNIKINLKSIDLVHRGLIDFLIIPQDDSSVYGLTAKDQQIVREQIETLHVNTKVYMYPDADAVANVLLARYMNFDRKVRPLFYVRYASGTGQSVVPLFEDRMVHETIKYQILAAGGLLASSASEADIILLVNVPGANMKDHIEMDTSISRPISRTMEYDANRNLLELVEFAEYAIEVMHKSVVMGDIAYANGGDPLLLDLLKEKKLLYRLSGYAGWNTSSNTLGTCIPMGAIYNIFGNTKSHLQFLASRYVEDVGYCAYVRREVTEQVLHKMGLHFHLIDGIRGNVSEMVKEKLQEFANTFLEDDQYAVKVKDSCQPWNRMFEVGVTVDLIKKYKEDE